MRPPTPLVCAVVLAACTSVSSLDYAVSDSAAVFDPRLLGEWTTRDFNGRVERAHVGRIGRVEYGIRYVDGDGDTSWMVGRLGHLDTRWLLDLYPAAEGLQAIDRHGGIPTHWQLVLEVADSVIRAAAFNADSMKAFVQRRQHPPFAFALRPNGDLLLTDRTPQLSQALADYARLPEALGPVSDWSTYRRP